MKNISGADDMRIGNKERYYIYTRENKRCFYCRKELRYDQATLDHYYPTSAGGESEIFNLVLCCKRCNKLKGSKIPDGFEDVISELFKKAVYAGFITGGDIRLGNNELVQELLKIDKLESISDGFVFQSPDKRYYVKNGTVIKVIYVDNNREKA